MKLHTPTAIVALGLTATAAPIFGLEELKAELSEGVGLAGKALRETLQGVAEAQGVTPKTDGKPIEKRDFLPTTPGLVLTDTLMHGHGPRDVIEERDIQPTTPELALTNTLMHGFGFRDEIEETNVQPTTPDLAPTDSLMHELDPRDGYYEKPLLPFTPELAIISALMRYFGAKHEQRSTSNSDKQKRDDVVSRSLGSPQSQGYCYFEREGGLYVKHECNPDSKGMHCYLENGKCEVVTKREIGHRAPDSEAQQED